MRSTLFRESIGIDSLENLHSQNYDSAFCWSYTIKILRTKKYYPAVSPCLAMVISMPIYMYIHYS